MKGFLMVVGGITVACTTAFGAFCTWTAIGQTLAKAEEKYNGDTSKAAKEVIDEAEKGWKSC